uniref:Radical SAM core domain-containing protein n=1 Tax=Proboscia inermis TaxID=420281 RepID=A0A6T8J7A6_9STRA|mmetsp:Transcript_28710/g.29053  ORF Transcript_28710/g.29053 Transcript_28710/m.29053 type:complete len:472 (+) Transcript_28710:136-1551(+)
MGFARQLTSDEIFEQVARFDSELKQNSTTAGSDKQPRVSNVVMMGMGEPLANYRNVMGAIRRMNTDLGIGARRITVSTVGVVPNIYKLIEEDIQIRLAVSLHCSDDEARTKLLPANARYGGLEKLMDAVKEYIEVTKRRITFEWALIDGQNDSADVARSLGRLIKRHGLRRDFVHVNLIPLNPTGGFEGGRPSQRKRVDGFVKVLVEEFGISATPRVRRGIDINAGCGQLKAKVMKKEKASKPAETDKIVKSLNAKFEDDGINFGSPQDAMESNILSMVGVYEDDDADDIFNDENVEYEKTDDDDQTNNYDVVIDKSGSENTSSIVSDFIIDPDVIHIDHDDFENDVQLDSSPSVNNAEIERLMSIVLAELPVANVESDKETKQLKQIVKTEANDTAGMTTITDEASVRKAKQRRKKLIKNLKGIQKLKEMQARESVNGDALYVLNDEQRTKIGKEELWRAELESVEHNLQ